MSYDIPAALAPERIAEEVEAAIRACATTLRPDVRAAVEHARDEAVATGEERAASILEQVLENARIGAQDGVPICQDTGTVWVCLEVGEELIVPGNVFSQVNAAVERAYGEGRLRMSVVRDALRDRANTGSNAPAFCELRLVPGDEATLHVMLKGGGSDNASRVVMLPPGAGREGVKQAVLDCVREKAANACPPLVVGVGVGATFDKVAGLAKHALLREVGSPAASGEAAAFEAELLEAINATGIGPAALGGMPTALAVHLETAPCHIAALPVAINMGCCAMRSKSVKLVSGNTSTEQEPGPCRSTDARLKAEKPAPSDMAPRPASHPVELTLPLSREDVAQLRAGDEVLLSGPVHTMRDAGHARALEALAETGELPFGLKGQTLFYAGPTPAAAGRPLGSVGPTTASRMDFATPQLMHAGIVGCIGKGKRSPEVVRACEETGSAYFATVGGIAALLATHVVASEDVAWEDLGTEALRRLTLDRLPAFVAVDTHGNDLYREIEMRNVSS